MKCYQKLKFIQNMFNKKYFPYFLLTVKTIDEESYITFLSSKSENSKFY